MAPQESTSRGMKYKTEEEENSEEEARPFPETGGDIRGPSDGQSGPSSTINSQAGQSGTWVWMSNVLAPMPHAASHPLGTSPHPTQTHSQAGQSGTWVWMPIVLAPMPHAASHPLGTSPLPAQTHSQAGRSDTMNWMQNVLSSMPVSASRPLGTSPHPTQPHSYSVAEPGPSTLTKNQATQQAYSGKEGDCIDNPLIIADDDSDDKPSSASQPRAQSSAFPPIHPRHMVQSSQNAGHGGQSDQRRGQRSNRVLHQNQESPVVGGGREKRMKQPARQQLPTGFSQGQSPQEQGLGLSASALADMNQSMALASSSSGQRPQGQSLGPSASELAVVMRSTALANYPDDPFPAQWQGMEVSASALAELEQSMMGASFSSGQGSQGHRMSVTASALADMLRTMLDSQFDEVIEKLKKREEGGE